MGFGKENKGAILREAVVATLLGMVHHTAVFFTGGIVLTNDSFRMLKAILAGSVNGLTAGQGEGLYVGIAQGDQSVAEIAATLVLDGPVAARLTDISDVAEKPVWLIAGFDTQKSTTGTRGSLVGANGGKLATGTQQWTYPKGVGWNYFMWNEGLALTTGASATMTVTEFGVWVD